MSAIFGIIDFEERPIDENWIKSMQTDLAHRGPDGQGIYQEASMFLGLMLLQVTPESIYDIEINNLTGEPINLNDYKGKYILFVNVASECGFTGQYDDLQKLYETYKDKLIVIGVPCNQFGKQEPGSAKEIQSFCQANYGVSFLMTEKVNVKGKNKHPIYQWLTEETKNGKTSSSKSYKPTKKVKY